MGIAWGRGAYWMLVEVTVTEFYVEPSWVCRAQYSDPDSITLHEGMHIVSGYRGINFYIL
jgi:hypothetical protein